MKPPAFTYYAPTTLDQALKLVAEHGESGKVLAGGQSLVPLLNFRLAHPDHLIDLNGVGELSGIRRRKGTLHIGAMTRQTMLERSQLVGQHWGLLADAVSYVGHAQIRNRGTVGGSVAHADPAAELPAAFTALDARFRIRSARGERQLGAEDFFLTHLTTALASDELLVEIEVPPQPAGTGHSFAEFARRHGDFAIAGAAVAVSLDVDNRCQKAAIALLAAARTPVRAGEAERLLIGSAVDDELVASAAELAAAEIEPTGDIHGSAEYRKHLIEVMARRAISTASAQAKAALTRQGSTNGAGGGLL